MDSQFSKQEIRNLERKFGLIPDYFTPAYFEGRLDAIAKVKPKGRVLKHGKGKCPPDKGWVQPKGRKGFCRTLPEVKALQGTLKNPVNKYGREVPNEPPKNQFPAGLIVGGIGGAAIGGAIALMLGGQGKRDDVSRQAYDNLQQELEKETIKAREAQAKQKEVEEQMAQNEAERIKVTKEKEVSDKKVEGLKKQVEKLKKEQAEAQEKVGKQPPSNNGTGKKGTKTQEEYEEEIKKQVQYATQVENEVKRVETELETAKQKNEELKKELDKKLKNHEDLLKMKIAIAEVTEPSTGGEGYKNAGTVNVEQVTKRAVEQLKERKALAEARDKAIAEQTRLTQELEQLKQQQQEKENQKAKTEEEIQQETDAIALKQQEIDKLTEAKDALEIQHGKLKSALKEAGITEELFEPEKSEDLTIAIKALSENKAKHIDNIENNLTNDTPEQAISNLSQLRDEYIAIAKKLYGVEDGADFTALDEKIKETLGKKESGQYDLREEILSQAEFLNQMVQGLEDEMTEIKSQSNALGKTVLGERYKPSGTVAKTLEKIKESIETGKAFPEMANLKEIKQKYQDIVDSIRLQKKGLGLTSTEIDDQVQEVLQKVKVTADLQEKINNLTALEQRTKKELVETKRILSISQQSNNKLTRENENFKIQVAALEGELNTSKLKLQEAESKIFELKQKANLIENSKKELTNQFKTTITEETTRRNEMEAYLLANFDRSVLKQSEEAQNKKMKEGYILHNPDEGLSLTASKGWGSTFFDRGTGYEKEKKVGEACRNIENQMFMEAQSSLQKRMLEDLDNGLKGFDDETAKLFAPLETEFANKSLDQLSDVSESYAVYQAIRKWGKEKDKPEQQSFSESSYQKLLENVTKRKGKGTENAGELQKLYEEYQSSFEPLRRIEASNQLLKLRQTALTKASFELGKAYQEAHIDLLKELEAQKTDQLDNYYSPEALDQFDKRSRELTKTFGKEMEEVTRRLLDNDNIQRVVETMKGNFAIAMEQDINTLQLEWDNKTPQSERDEYLKYNLLTELTGISRDRINTLFSKKNFS